MVDPLRFANAVIFLIHLKSWWKDFGKARKQWRPFASARRESYAAEKYHNTRTSGVIGIALFNEMSSDPWKNEEVRRRLKANPCPGGFATHP
jgi:hypothetical protein